MSEWTLRIVPQLPILSANAATHRQAGSRYRKRMRRITYSQALIGGLPVGLPKARVDVILSFPRNARRDTANYHPYVAKPIVDALGQPRTYTRRRPGRPLEIVTEPGYGVLLGDDPAHLHCTDCPHIRFGEPTGRNNPRFPFGLIVVVIADVSETADAQQEAS